MRYLRQSTATAVLIGPFIDDTDGKTPETALAVGSIDIGLYKASNTHPLTKIGVAPAASGSSHDMAHTGNGWYSLELTAGDTDTVGRFTITGNASGALPVWNEFQILPPEVYDNPAGAVWAYASRTLTAFGSNTLIEWTYTLTNLQSGQPLAYAQIRLSTDALGNNTVWVGTTDLFGIARDANGQKPRLSAGTYYVWRALSGFVFSDPDTETVG